MTRRKRKPFGERLIASLRGGLEAIEGGQELPRTFVPTPPDPPKFDRSRLVALRKELGMTQSSMAMYLNVSEKTVESWEQGVRSPNGAALRLLQVMSNPEILEPIKRKERASPSRKSRKLKTAAGTR